MGLPGQLAKPGSFAVADCSGHHCTASDTVKDSSVIIACNAAHQHAIVVIEN